VQAKNNRLIMAACYVREKNGLLLHGSMCYGHKVVYFSTEILSMDFIIMFRVLKQQNTSYLTLNNVGLLDRMALIHTDHPR
jgi:hypothetical protein